MKKTLRNVILFDDNEIRKHLMPFTYTRPTALLRVGITTIAEKWQALLGEANYSYLTVRYLKKKFPLHARRTSNLMVAGHVIPTPELASKVLALQQGEALMVGEELIAFNGSAHDLIRTTIPVCFIPTNCRSSSSTCMTSSSSMPLFLPRTSTA